jgi:hypothetical protein
MRAAGVGLLVALALGAQRPSPAPAGSPGFQPPQRTLPASAERAYQAVATRVDGAAAMDIVRFMDQYWRLAANPGFNASIDHIQQRLRAAGLTTRIEEFQLRSKGWDYDIGTVAFADSGEVLLSRERDRVSLCINSFSVPAIRVSSRLPISGTCCSGAACPTMRIGRRSGSSRVCAPHRGCASA